MHLNISEVVDMKWKLRVTVASSDNADKPGKVHLDIKFITLKNDTIFKRLNGKQFRQMFENLSMQSVHENIRNEYEKINKQLHSLEELTGC